MASTTATRTFHAPPVWVVSIFLALGLIAVASAFFIPIPKPDPTQTSTPVVQPPQYPDAPFFLLTERSGKEIGNADLDGKVWLASFQFTRCKYCPSVAATMSRLQSELKLGQRDDLRFVTFTIDPEHDTPDELRKYAETYRADPNKWFFLTGKEKLIRPLVNRGFKVAAVRNANAPVDLLYDHSLKLLLVDKAGHIRGTFDGMVGEPTPDKGVSELEQQHFQQKYDESCAELKRKIGELVKE